MNADNYGKIYKKIRPVMYFWQYRMVWWYIYLWIINYAVFLPCILLFWYMGLGPKTLLRYHPEWREWAKAIHLTSIDPLHEMIWCVVSGLLIPVMLLSRRWVDFAEPECHVRVPEHFWYIYSLIVDKLLFAVAAAALIVIFTSK